MFSHLIFNFNRNFRTSIETLELTDLNKSLNSLIKFLTFSFHGGTDMVPALEEALKQLKSENYKKADVLMISDFIIDKINSNIESQIEQTKQNGTKFHSLVISSYGNPNALEIFDNNWFYQSEGPYEAFKPILKNIRKLH